MSEGQGDTSAVPAELSQGDLIAFDSCSEWLDSTLGAAVAWYKFDYEIECFIVASQDCDLISADEPLVELLPCYREPDESTRINWRYSARRFAFGTDGLVADASRKIIVTAETLNTAKRMAWPDSEELFQGLRLWLGRRYSRPAYSDEFSAGVVIPIQEFVKKLKANRKARFSSLVREIRLACDLESQPPYNIGIVLIRREFALPSEDMDFLMSLETRLGEVAETLDMVASARVYSTDLSRINALQYFSTSLIALDGITYKGQEVIGVSPVFGN